MKRLTILLFMLAACSSPDDINIGGIFMLTGPAATHGKDSAQAAELAINEINQAGGINGRLLAWEVDDTKSADAKTSVTVLTRFINKDINVVIGPTWSNTAKAMAPIACSEHIILMSPTAGVAFNEECEYLFALRPHDEVLNEKFGRHIYQQGHKTLAIVGSTQAWEEEQARAVKKGFEGAGGTVVSFQLPQLMEQDYRTEATKVKAVNPDAIVFTNSAGQQTLARRLKELGVTTPFYSVLVYHETLETHNGFMEGTIVNTDFTPSTVFVAKFEQAYNRTPDIGADTSYDAIMLLAGAMRTTGSVEPEDLQVHLNALQEYTGESGYLVFDGKGGVSKEATQKKIQGKELVALS